MSSVATSQDSEGRAASLPGLSCRKPSTPARPASALAQRSRDNLNGWAFAAPFLVFFLVFLVWPLLYGMYMSLTGKSLTGANDSIIGLANYAEALADPDMWHSLGNTLYFTVISTVPLVVVALVMAALLNVGLPAQWLWNANHQHVPLFCFLRLRREPVFRLTNIVNEAGIVTVTIEYGPADKHETVREEFVLTHKRHGGLEVTSRKSLN